MSPRFHTLTVKDVRRETPDAVSVAFEVPPALGDDYRFAPGQYVTVRARVDGEECRRSYSICTPPSSGVLRIGVKQLPGGAFSQDVVGRLGRRGGRRLGGVAAFRVAAVIAVLVPCVAALRYPQVWRVTGIEP